MNPDIKQLIIRKRGQLMVHSYLYYKVNTSMWSDDKWQEVANDLVTLQAKYGTEVGFFDDLFQDWSGETGMHLCNEYAQQKAHQLIMYNPHCKVLGGL